MEFNKTYNLGIAKVTKRRGSPPQEPKNKLRKSTKAILALDLIALGAYALFGIGAIGTATLQEQNLSQKAETQLEQTLDMRSEQLTMHTPADGLYLTAGAFSMERGEFGGYLTRESAEKLEDKLSLFREFGPTTHEIRKTPQGPVARILIKAQGKPQDILATYEALSASDIGPKKVVGVLYSGGESMWNARKDSSYDPSIRPKILNLPYGNLIDQFSLEHGVNQALIAGIVQTESGFNPRAGSNKGAQGLMQLMPKTAAWLGVADRSNPEQNLEAGTRYFRQLLDKYEDPILALSAYNAGPTNVNEGRHVKFEETRHHVDKVLRMTDWYVHTEFIDGASSQQEHDRIIRDIRSNGTQHTLH